jgi:hypothetical protein
MPCEPSHTGQHLANLSFIVDSISQILHELWLEFG